ncbi:hypothetical protein PC110_g22671 [Phytophthora cactorum]|uniref:Integrase catalytic domain-containing protein n=1 Tax=Phytophthora cactorum TaxID=29920 RepID=A0A329RAK1_9STRA|nr:hypothetical protein PC110_g22671 [Phytophthora cactorum]
MEERSEVYDKFELLYEHVKTQSRCALRCDNARELTSLCGLCEKKYGMECSLIVKHTPEQNGIPERMKRTVTGQMRCLLAHFHLPQELGAEATVTTAYYINIVPNSTKGVQVP